MSLGLMLGRFYSNEALFSSEEGRSGKARRGENERGGFCYHKNSQSKEEKMRRLTKEDYAKDAVALARELLGCFLCRRLEDGTVMKARITETEAYYGEEDSACHASKGRTKRTETLYLEGGRAYVYLCYGVHEMMNVVSGPEGHPEAALIRGVAGAEGPGRLTKLLMIDRRLNGEDLTESEKIWLETDGTKARMKASPRIGIAYAEERDRKRKWRFTALASQEKNKPKK